MSNINEVVIAEEDIVRFAILFGASDARNFNTNLAKMVEIVLHHNYPKGMNSEDIALKIKELYQMEFSEEEVYDAIISDHKEKFTIIRDDQREKHLRVAMTERRHRAMDDKYVQNNISNIISEFYDEHDEFSCLNKDKIEECIKKYIYLKFNKDVETLKAILTPESTYAYEEGKIGDFSEEEKDILNSFFNWENKKKDSLIFEILSSALQYCMMTTRKDNSISTTMFRGKVFYLDTNIIFRMAGLNQEERKEVIENFIKKCKECGIKLKYTNYTKSEIDSTLDSHVKSLKNLTNGQTPLGKKGINALRPQIPKEDLYFVYLEWTRDTKNNKYNDYTAYRKYLDKQITSVLNTFEKVDFETYSGLKTGEDFECYVRELEAYKNANGVTSAYEQALKVDIENYMFLQEISKRENTTTLFDKKTYFISADHRLINWAAKKMSGAVPTFVLPSFWYSFMLRYYGRATENDFSTFCQFLKLRPAYKKIELEDTRAKLAQKIMFLEESSAIKDEIALDASERLRGFTTELTDEEIEVVFSAAFDSVIEKKVSEKVEEKLKEIEVIQKREVDGSFDEGTSIGRKIEREENIMALASRRAVRNKRIKQVTYVLCAIPFLCGAFFLVYQLAFVGSNEQIEKITGIIDNPIVCIIFSGLLFFVTKFLGSTDFLTEDIEKLKKKVEKSISNNS